LASEIGLPAFAPDYRGRASSYCDSDAPDDKKVEKKRSNLMALIGTFDHERAVNTNSGRPIRHLPIHLAMANRGGVQIPPIPSAC